MQEKKMIALDDLWNILNEHGIQRDASVQHDIESAAIAAIPAVHGHWILKRRARGRYMYNDHYCSRCGGQAPDNWMDHCARCGAIMDEETDNTILYENRMERV